MYIAMRAGVVVHVYIERSALFSAVCFWNVYACVCMRMFNKVSLPKQSARVSSARANQICASASWDIPNPLKGRQSYPPISLG